MTENCGFNLNELSDDTLLAMQEAAEEVNAAMSAARRASSNIVWDILRLEDEIIFDQHYPKDNVYDNASGSQYYYHSHRPGEHGHFHCFMMKDGLSKTAVPIPDQRMDLRDPDFKDPFVHLVAFSMNDYGEVKKRFHDQSLGDSRGCLCRR